MPNKNYKYLSLLIGLTFVFFSQLSFAASDYIIEIHKADRQLLIKKDNLVKKSFRIATGSGGSGDKTRRGDKKTPIGVYKVLSFKNESPFHYFIQLNYPNSKDAIAGLKNNIINKDEFNQIIYNLKRKQIPSQNTPLGGAIGIHGIGEETPERLAVHKDENWTKGCIAMKNNEIEELLNYLKIGTSVVIFE